jgi:hypothetical protein
MDSIQHARPRWERRPLTARAAAARKRLRPAVEQLEDRTTPALLGTPTPVVSLVNFGPGTNGGLTANLLFTLPGGAQQMATTSAAITSMQRVHGCPILNLTLGPVHLDVLGLVVDLQQLNLKVQAIPGRGQLLGNLLCNPALKGQRLLNTVVSELNTLLSAGNLLGNLTAPASPLGTGVPLNVPQLSTDLTSAGVAPGTTSCPILSLDTGPIDLNLLGLNVSVPTGVHLKVTAVPSSQPGGGVLGDLLCQLSMALDNSSLLAGKLTTADLTNIVNSLANTLGRGQPALGPLSLGGLPRGALNAAASMGGGMASARSCNVLSLTVGPINLNVLGLKVTTSPICLNITAQRGPGNLLGNLLCGPGITGANLLQAVSSVLNTLGALDALGGGTATGLLSSPQTLQRAISDLTGTLGSLATPTASCQILNLNLGPLNLNLLGLIVTLNNCATPPGPVNVNVTAIPGTGNLLGNLLCDLAGLLPSGL